MSARVGAVHPLLPSLSPSRSAFHPSHIIVRARVESFSGRDHRNFGQQRLGDISMYHGLTERNCREAGLTLLAFFFLLARFPFDDCLNRLLLLLQPGAAWPVFDSNASRRLRVGMNGGGRPLAGERGKFQAGLHSCTHPVLATETRYLRKTGTKRPVLCQPGAD